MGFLGFLLTLWVGQTFANKTKPLSNTLRGFVLLKGINLFKHLASS